MNCPPVLSTGGLVFYMEKMEYTIIRSARKTISIQLSPDGSLVVRAPQRMPKRDIERFLEEKRGWVEDHLAKLPELQPKLTDAELGKLARHAREVLPEIVAHFAPLVGVDYGRITIRAQRTRCWIRSRRLLADMPEARGSPNPRLTKPFFSMRMPVAKSSVTLPV